MATGDKLATVIPLPAAAPHHHTRIPASSDLGLQHDRVTMRRHVLAALLRHGTDGLRGDCYCGLHPRSLRMHMASAVAGETHLPRSYVDQVMGLHRNAVGITDLVCDCGETYSTRNYEREEHLAEVLAANIPTIEVRRCLDAIRSAGRAR